jgi:hypothetical protein
MSSLRQRTRWRFIFRDLFADARHALAGDDPMPAAEAMATLVDIACETGGLDYFRSEDPVEAAKIVISDEVKVLWCRVRDCGGFAAFAAPQLVRWERSYGWTRGGWGQVRQKETTLAAVLTPMLDVPDALHAFVRSYLTALDACAPEQPASRPDRGIRPTGPDASAPTILRSGTSSCFPDSSRKTTPPSTCSSPTRRSAGRISPSCNPASPTCAATSIRPASASTRLWPGSPATPTSLDQEFFFVRA